jgi:hypothetical protein
MIKNEEVARQISDLMLECGRRIDASIAMVHERCDAEDFKRYRRAAGQIMGALYLEVMQPIYSEHPGIKPEGLD